jgi:hypothetical protein
MTISIYTLIILNFWISAQEQNPQALKQKTEMTDRCLIQKNPLSCDENTLTSGKSENAVRFGEMGCDTLHSMRSCQYLGDHYKAKGNKERAESYFKKSCDLKSSAGCMHLAESTLSGTSPTKLPDAKALFEKACELDSTNRMACAQVSAVEEQIKKYSNQVLKNCSLRYRIRRADDQSSHEDIKKSESPEPISKPECLARCQNWIKAFPTGSDDLQLRAQCQFDDKVLGEVSTRMLKSPSPCSTESRQFGSDDEPLYHKCFCESFEHAQIQNLAKPFGIYAEGKVAWSKSLNNDIWSRCSIGLRYTWEAKIKNSSPDCKKNLSALKKILRKERSAKNFEIDYGSVSCR